MKNNYGLQLLPEDKQDFDIVGFYGFLPDLEELPESFELPILEIKNQGGTDFCSAYASCGMSELQEGVQLYSPYSFAASKEISGGIEEWGQDLRSALKAHQKWGALALKDVPEGVKSLSDKALRDFKVYSHELREKAYKYRKKSYFLTKGQYDAYDNIRASIWKFREQKRGVEIGLIFAWPLAQYKLDTISQNGFGHALYITGWDSEGLIAVNSYGNAAGRAGKHRITREVIEAFVGRYGAYMMIDIDPEDVKKQLQRKEWTLASIYGKILIILRNLWK